jgi:hypothetical protein
MSHRCSWTYEVGGDEWQREVPGVMTTDEVLINSISFFNQELGKRHQAVQLKDKSSLYRLHIAKKNGLPKDDLPRTLASSPSTSPRPNAASDEHRIP